jgi:hypothetical protein
VCVCHPKLHRRLRLGESGFQAAWAKNFARPHLNRKKLGMVAYTCYPSYGGRHKIGESQGRLDWVKSEILFSK